jgi:2-dehydro-3-deoxygluconokinase
MHTHGIAQDCVARHPTKTPGLYAIETDDQGERRFSYWRSDSAARTLFGPECTLGMNILSRFDLVYVSGISLAILPPTQRHALIEALIYYQARGGIVAYDSNHRPKLWESPEIARETNAVMWDFAALALPSVDDEMHIFNDADASSVVARLCKHGPRVGALKQGHLGPYDLEQDTVQTYGAAANVVDSTAAGDSFNAGFLAGYIAGASVGERLMQAHDLAARVVQHRGAILPDRELVHLANRQG